MPAPVTLDVESYARAHPHIEEDVVPPLLERYLRSRAFERVLDAGCGDGALARALVARGIVKRLLACDASATRIVRVRAASGGAVDAFVDDVETLREVADGSIDFFLSSQVIEHVDDARMLAAIARVTHPGSLVWISTVHKRAYAWYFYRNHTGWVLDPTHLREYRKDDELLAKLPSGAFRVLENTKTKTAFPLVDFFAKRLRADRNLFARRAWLRRLRTISVPILGYYTWELVLERKEAA